MTIDSQHRPVHRELPPATALEVHDGTPELVAVTGFDFATLDAALGWSEPCNPLRDLSDERLQLAAETLHQILDWCTSAKTSSAAGLRILALAFLVRPELFEGETASYVAAKFNASKQGLGRFLIQARERFGIHSSRKRRVR